MNGAGAGFNSYDTAMGVAGAYSARVNSGDYSPFYAAGAAVAENLPVMSSVWRAGEMVDGISYGAFDSGRALDTADYWQRGGMITADIASAAAAIGGMAGRAAVGKATTTQYVTPSEVVSTGDVRKQPTALQIIRIKSNH